VVFFNYTTMQMTAKIVYYGPGLCGKTTNLQYIHQKTAPQSRGEMISLETETDRTLFFDLLPIDVGVIGGMKVRLQLYTVPGQVFYNATRKLVLKGVDGIVFVADSQTSMLDSNIESLTNLKANLAELDLGLEQLPVVFQYNKRDIRNIHTVEKLSEVLNPGGFPFYEAAALHGVGVYETLKGISRLAIQSVRHKLAPDAKAAGATSVSVPTAAKAAPSAAPRPAPSAKDLASDPLSHLVGSGGEDLAVEFPEEDTGKLQVRPVETKGHLDIQSELERLRAMTGVAKPAAAKSEPTGADKRLRELLVTDARQEVKRKSAVEVPLRVLRGAKSVRLQIVFDTDKGPEVVEDATAIQLVGNKKLDRLALKLELDLKGKE
jgi:mutual gliding-motility protein MglA